MPNLCGLNPTPMSFDHLEDPLGDEAIHYVGVRYGVRNAGGKEARERVFDGDMCVHALCLAARVVWEVGEGCGVGLVPHNMRQRRSSVEAIER